MKPESQTTKREAAISEMARCLTECARQFSFYEENHVKKTPPDHEKAATNHRFSVMCHEALTNWELNK